MAAMPEGEVFTIKEVAQFLKLSMQTVRNLIAGGQLKAFRAGHHYRVTRESLQKFMGEESPDGPKQEESPP